MQRKRFTWWLATALVIMLFALTGCQVIQGLDVSQALQNSSALTSAESRSSLQMDIIAGDTSHLSADEKLMIQMLNHITLDLNNAKMQDKQHVSVDGALTYSKGSIPFKLVVDGNKIIIHIDGAKKPLVFDPLALQSGSSAAALSEDIQKQLFQKGTELQPALLKFFITNAPNPAHFSVSSVSEQVYNETLSLQKAHLEINGSEFVDLLKAFLTNIVADEKGMKELIGQFYDVLIPVIKEQMKASAFNSEMNSVMPDLMSAYLNNKTLAVEFVYTTLHEFLAKALLDWDKNMKDTFASPTDAQAKALLSEQTTLQTDLFIDSDKQIRKVRTELSIPITNVSSGVKALKFTYNNEVWNINKPVKADRIDVSGGVFNIDPTTITSSSILSNFNKDSRFYKTLREDLKVTKKEIHLIVDNTDDDPYLEYYFGASHPYINEDKITMLPVRFISEKLGAEIKWDEKSKQITVKDGVTDTIISLAVNSKTATVNGSPVQLDSAPIIKQGSTFVPLRFIAETLGCKVSFDDDSSSVTITRD
ncbi:copper amine oxidase N-terminal domain-containing protein [Paenibacillus sp. N3.4]|uniref:copper amine oxidase N-terminal domain-containing protein n=1 Tax=Paenibacillus sp. N3.4 TaxID=2603222 RepID=UPI0011CB4617|nr:copper amine oxidase N-terminal domain-containing protein [Paenibacillus sp. N3.4]TXK74810.1 copper amine oxidase N-terminal domain-containing protein [Paenibacillus sp. N3.4]